MNNKGQALVEFILILPIFILILFVIIDFGMIINTKSSLENNSIDVVELIKNNENLTEIKSLYKDLIIDVTSYDNYIKVTLQKEVDIMTPGLNRVLEDPYIVKVERIIYND